MSEIGLFLEDKCMNFSIRIVNLCHFVNEEKHEYRLADQLFRSGTSIGANLAEAQCAQSKKDFIAKTYIALKECNESLYWLKLMRKTDILNDQQYNSINYDCVELKKLLVSITKKATNNSTLDNSTLGEAQPTQQSTINSQQ